MKQCYYAHCMAIYDTPQEKRDIELLEKLGFEVINPNTLNFQDGFKVFKTTHLPEQHMYFWTGVALNCDVLAFRACPDGSITAGVAQEVAEMKKYNKPVFELPSSISRRILTVEQTKEYLKETGQQ